MPPDLILVGLNRLAGEAKQRRCAAAKHRIESKEIVQHRTNAVRAACPHNSTNMKRLYVFAVFRIDTHYYAALHGVAWSVGLSVAVSVCHTSEPCKNG